MESYAKCIVTGLLAEPENKIFEASDVYNKRFKAIPEASYYKTLERLCRKGIIVHLTKGLYYRPKKSRFGMVPISEEDIIRHYIGNRNGMVIGYRLYNRKGLTTQIGKRVEVLSCNISEQTKNIEAVRVTNCNVRFSEETVAVIEVLEILQNYKKIEDINKGALAVLMKKFADNYSDETAVYVLQNLKYKKSTIAFLRTFLDYHGVENRLDQFLSVLSSYYIPPMEEFYEASVCRRK